MGWFRRSAKHDDRLIGRWQVDPADAASIEALGDIAIEFDADGNLIYIIRSGERDEVILMTYRVDGDTIVTDQPSHPRPERTRYAISGDGALTLWFAGAASRFVRVTAGIPESAGD